MTDLGPPRGAELAALWFACARAMACASATEAGADTTPDGDPSTARPDSPPTRRDPMEVVQHSGAGLYAQAVLGLSEADCIAGKDPATAARMTLVACMMGLRRMERDTREKVVTGAMMMAFGQRRLTPLAVRWASALASVCELSPHEFEACTLSGRILSDMMQPQRRAG